jgi:hypothetical protein
MGQISYTSVVRTYQKFRLTSLLSFDVQARNPGADVAGAVFNCGQHLQKPQKIKL